MTFAVSRRPIVFGFQALAMAWAVSTLGGCSRQDKPITSQQSNYQVADSSSESETGSPGAAAPSVTAGEVPEIGPRSDRPPQKPPTRIETGDTVDPTSGVPGQLLAYIEDLQTRGITEISQEQGVALIRMADQVLAMEVSDSVRLTAAQAKLTALYSLVQQDQPGARDQLLEFCQTLKEGGHPLLADLGRRFGFQAHLEAFARGIDQDPQPMFDHFSALIAHEEKGEQLIQWGRNISSVLEQNGYPEEAKQILNSVAAVFQDVDDPQLAASIQSLREETDVVASSVRTKFVDALRGDKSAEEEFLSAAEKLLESDQRGISTVDFLLQQAAFNLESTKPEVAGRLYEMVQNAYADHENKELSEFVTNTIERYQKRARLIGQPFEVEGVKLNGEPFDWSQYEGKVVLVDFWATWCVPCLEEIPNIKANYARYQEQGFEVVGVNLDNNPEDVERFFSLQELPWPTVLSADPQSRGMETPLAVEIGVEFIPFIVVVGRDGKVAALNVRGDRLGPKVEELLSQPQPSTGSSQSPGVAGRPTSNR